jgi:hypothetical protein
MWVKSDGLRNIPCIVGTDAGKMSNIKLEATQLIFEPNQKIFCSSCLINEPNPGAIDSEIEIKVDDGEFDSKPWKHCTIEHSSRQLNFRVPCAAF